LTIPEVMTIKTLADVRTLLGHLPKSTREKSTWRQFHQPPISHRETID
jgi:hypothetical protein